MTEETIHLPSWSQSVREAVLLVDRGGRILDANTGAGRILGCDPEELARMNLRDLIHLPEVANELFVDLAQITSGDFTGVLDVRNFAKQDFPCEFNFHSHPGHDGWLLIARPTIENEDQAERLVLRALQLTSQMSSVEAKVHELSAELLDKTLQLAEEKNKTLAVLTSMGEGLVVVGPEGEIVQTNQAACRVLDLDSESILGTSLKDQPAGTKIAAVGQVIDNLRSSVLENGEESSGPTRIEVQEKVFELSIAPIHEGQSLSESEGGVVVNLRDVTKQAEIERMKNELISIVSHELRSPLANITGYIDLVLSDPEVPLTEEQRNLLQVAHKNSQKLSKLIDDMLDLSKLDAGKAEMNFDQVDLESLINFAHLSFRHEAEMKGVEFEKRIQGQPKVIGDIDRLQQVLNNLVSNAIKYTPEGGKVSLECEANGSSVEIAVVDSGIGITPENQAKLFQRFFRVRSSETRKIRGTGLGLSIAKSIVDAHGGRLTVSSEHGKGSRFVVNLPSREG
ncbi:MAG: PAS domain S-box protein [Candidatus Omnitrophica bacterium]|nr:PAS domain S-box protein [Candidatus Omnitrophota bacterium]